MGFVVGGQKLSIWSEGIAGVIVFVIGFGDDRTADDVDVVFLRQL